MSTYEEFMLLIAVVSIIISILKYHDDKTQKK